MFDKMFKQHIDYFKNISFVSLSGIVLSGVYIALDGVDFVSGFGSLMALFGTSYSVTGIVEVKRNINKIKKTKDSTAYNECVNLYNEYVCDIASFFKQMGINEGISSYAFYLYGLNKGYFSEGLINKYVNYKKNFDYFPELLGSTVSTGKSCCRHNAALFTDIVNEMGGLAANVSVNREYIDNKVKRDKPNHMVTSIISGDKKIIVDPTVPFDNLLCGGLYIFDDEKLEQGKIVAKLFLERANLLKLESQYDYPTNDSRFEEILKYPSFLSVDKVVEDYTHSLSLCFKYENDFICFATDFQPKVKKLARLNEMIMPHSKK